MVAVDDSDSEPSLCSTRQATSETVTPSPTHDHVPDSTSPSPLPFHSAGMQHRWVAGGFSSPLRGVAPGGRHYPDQVHGRAAPIQPSSASSLGLPLRGTIRAPGAELYPAAIRLRGEHDRPPPATGPV